MAVKVKPAGWCALVLGGAGLALLWSAHATDRGSVSWTDPAQPPAMLPLPPGRCGARIDRTVPYARVYPSSLSSWDGSVVGDC